MERWLPVKINVVSVPLQNWGGIEAKNVQVIKVGITYITLG